MGPLSVAAALDFASNIRSNLLTKFPLISNFPFSLCHLNIYIFFFGFSPSFFALFQFILMLHARFCCIFYLPPFSYSHYCALCKIFNIFRKLILFLYPCEQRRRQEQ